MRTRQALSELIEGRLASPDGRAELVKLATRLIVEEALEAECRDALGRDYYERGAEAGHGYRNGVRSASIPRPRIRFTSSRCAATGPPNNASERTSEVIMGATM
jgi:putative transposase